MISALPTDIKPATLLVMLSLLLSVFAPSLSSASDGNHPPGTAAPAAFSADDFDWREIVPYLFTAASLPGEQGIQAVLENSNVFRAYVGNEASNGVQAGQEPVHRQGRRRFTAGGSEQEDRRDRSGRNFP